MTLKSTPKKATASAAPKADAIKMLTSDHKQVHALFKQYASLCKADADGDERGQLAEQICAELTVHATLEEEIFYPAARDAGVEAALLDEAEVEHASVKALITQIGGMDPEDELYDAKVTVLGEYIDHHVKEEQDEMFPKCAKSAMDLKAIGAEMATRKVELVAAVEAQARHAALAEH